MGEKMKRLLILLAAALVLLAGAFQLPEHQPPAPEPEQTVTQAGAYTDRDRVAEYIYLYGGLPGNYITKAEARGLGWDAQAGNLWDVAPGKSIGGDRFGNYEGSLPEAPGRTYYECDIDYAGGHRNAKRIVYSDDGLIFYTDDHYDHFTQLYGEAEP